MEETEAILDNVKITLDTAKQRNEVAGLMARLNMANFDEPCEANVELGDNLILIEKTGAYRTLPIVEVGVIGVYARTSGVYVEYCDAVVQKPKALVEGVNREINRRLVLSTHSPLNEGTYLIGSAIKKRIDRLQKCNPHAN